MQQTFVSPAVLLRARRSAAGLSASALARRAGVPASTVTRIESGVVDPTFTMLQRLLAAAGCDLTLETTPYGTGPSLADLASALDEVAADHRINWTRLRGFVDWTIEHPERTSSAIRRPPPRSGEPLLDNLLAGMAEQLADDVGIERPRWCRKVPPLAVPYETPGTPRMRARNRSHTPGPLAERNVFVSAASLWRDPR